MSNNTTANMTPPPPLTILAEDMLSLYECGDGYDVELRVGGEPDMKTFRAHSNVLRARCAYFRAALSNTWAKCDRKGADDEKVIVFTKPNASPAAFEIILRYIYAGVIDLTDVLPKEMVEVLEMADELSVASVLDYTQDVLVNVHSTWAMQNFEHVQTLAYAHPGFTRLQTWCSDVACRDPAVLLSEREDIQSVEEALLLEVIQRDDFEVDELSLWEYLIDWGRAKTSLSHKNVMQWTEKEFSTMEVVLRNLLPYVRFAFIRSGDMSSKVDPYKSVLPITLRRVLRVARHSHLPHQMPIGPYVPRRGPIDSLLVRSRHAALISHWIDGNDDNIYDGQRAHDIRRLPYTFRLLLRGTRDGFHSSVFHNLCDAQGPTITFIRVRRTHEIIGGYNPEPWDSSNRWGTSAKSFIFRFDAPDKVDNAVGRAMLARVVDERHAFLRSSVIGPCFGSGDLVIGGSSPSFNSKDSCSCHCVSYTRSIFDAGRFAVDEYEVFLVERE